MKTAPTAERVLPGRWSSLPLFRRRPRVLSFDIFGFALEPAVLESDDVHRLVASYLRDELGEERGSSDADWLRVRRLAEEQARHALSELGRGDAVGIPAVREQLIELLGPASGQADGSVVASSAIRREIQLHGDLWQANPVAHDLYRAALAQGTTIAFLADSPLPRDLVSRLLQQADYRHGIVLVSSQEGATKESGDLYAVLANRVGEVPDRITHLGPDPETDCASAAARGVRTCAVGSGRGLVMDQIVAGLVDRTGVDAVALALAADRVAASTNPDFRDIGYYAGGPLATGFCAWVGREIAESRPDHVFFCGPAGRLLRQVTTLLRPDLPAATMHELDSDNSGVPPPEGVTDLAARLDLHDGDRVVTVDLGWDGQPHRWLGDALGRPGPRLGVAGAYLGVVDEPATAPISAWALTGSPDCALTPTARPQLDALGALLPSLRPDFGDGSRTGGDAAMRQQLTSGVMEYARDVAPWLAKLPDDISPALTEPALRLVADPSPAERELLAGSGEAWRQLAVAGAAPGQQPISRWRRRPPEKPRSLPPDQDRRP